MLRYVCLWISRGEGERRKGWCKWQLMDKLTSWVKSGVKGKAEQKNLLQQCYDGGSWIPRRRKWRGIGGWNDGCSPLNEGRQIRWLVVAKLEWSQSVKDFKACVTPLQRKRWCCNFKRVKCTRNGACLQRVSTTCPIYIHMKLTPMSYSFVPLFLCFFVAKQKLP